MRRNLFALAVIAFASTLAFGEVEPHDTGQWPRSWPRELEPLRKQARTLSGGKAMLASHEILFTDREQCEAAWPHLLKVKAEGAQVVLHRGASAKYACQLRIQSPSANARLESPDKPLAYTENDRTRWIKSQYVEMWVDGEIVDLNRTLIPADTPIVDKRFKDVPSKP